MELAGGGNWIGGAHRCARTTGGSVLCWGITNNCGPTLVETAPTIVDGLDQVVQISVGADFGCALLAGGTVKCWGNNCEGELGQGDKLAHTGAVQVPGLSGVTTIGAGTFHVCARAPGGIYCWRRNLTGQCGAGATDQKVTSPTLVPAPPELDDVVQIAGSVDASCALTSAGDVYCWGRGDFGLMGDGSIYTEPCPDGELVCALTPKKAALSGVVEIALGYEFGVARLASGKLRSWGADEYAQLGNGSISQNAYSPVEVSGFP